MLTARSASENGAAGWYDGMPAAATWLTARSATSDINASSRSRPRTDGARCGADDAVMSPVTKRGTYLVENLGAVDVTLTAITGTPPRSITDFAPDHAATFA